MKSKLEQRVDDDIKRMTTRQKVELAVDLLARKHYAETGMIRDLPYEELTEFEKAILDEDVACGEDE